MPRLTPKRRCRASNRAGSLWKPSSACPVAYAQVVTLMLEGMTYQEIADVLGISETNVGAQLTRGRDMLRSLLRSSNAG